MALGVGLALARTERERRQRRRHAQRQLGLQPGERLADALPRMALGQIDLTLELLGDQHTATDARTVHETRKALKRLRALLRLLKHQLGAKAYARESKALRDTARRLSGARDAQVMIAQLDGLIARHPRKLGRRRGARQLRKRLLAEHQRLQQLTLGDPATRDTVAHELRAFRGRLATWELPDRNHIELVHTDLERLYRNGRKRYRRVARRDGEHTTAMHEWRKRVKDLRYAAEMLQARGSHGRLRELARRADALGELLGEDHDLAVLAERLRASGRRDAQQAWRTEPKTRKALLKAIAKRRHKLRKRALRQGERLYGEPPKLFMRRIRGAYIKELSRR